MGMLGARGRRLGVQRGSVLVITTHSSLQEEGHMAGQWVIGHSNLDEKGDLVLLRNVVIMQNDSECT